MYRSAKVSSVVSYLAGHCRCTRLQWDVQQASGPAADTQSPRRLLKPRVHLFIGLSERNERRPPVGASHTGLKKKENKKRRLKPTRGSPRRSLSQNDRRRERSDFTQIRQQPKLAGAESAGPCRVRVAGQREEAAGHTFTESARSTLVVHFVHFCTQIRSGDAAPMPRSTKDM